MNTLASRGTGGYDYFPSWARAKIWSLAAVRSIIVRHPCAGELNRWVNSL